MWYNYNVRREGIKNGKKIYELGRYLYLWGLYIKTKNNFIKIPIDKIGIVWYNYNVIKKGWFKWKNTKLMVQ